MQKLTQSLLVATALTTSGLGGLTAAQARSSGRNVLLFVADGLRAGSVNGRVTPTMNRVKTQGVWFSNSHSIFPTFTTANASALATGHYLGDTGDFSNTIYTGYPEPFSNGTETPFLENDLVQGDVDARFAGTVTRRSGETVQVGYLDEETILAAARSQGYRTASIGKVGPVVIFDTNNSALVPAATRDTRGTPTIFVDDATGSASGIPLDPGVSSFLAGAGIPVTTPGRGANGSSGDNNTPGTNVANLVQQDYFVQAAADVVLPELQAGGQPFVMVFWSRDPDGTQHNQGDSLNQVVPGINGPTSQAGIANADSDLARLMDALDRLGLSKNTDVIVTADHGFSTISKNPGADFSQSRTSYAATQTYRTYRTVGGTSQLVQEVPTGFLPAGFLAIDIAHEFNTNLFDPDGAPASAPKPVTPASYPPVVAGQPPAADGTQRQRPTSGDGVIGATATNPDIVVAANGGSDLIYLPNQATRTQVAQQLVPFLLKQDYVSGVFVDESVGRFPGTLPTTSINFVGNAITPSPTVVVNFASVSTRGHGCPFATDDQCGVEIADSTLQQGQGQHGNFSRADTFNFMAAAGPDFKRGFNDPAPVSNADIGKTIASILQLRIPSNGSLVGRVLREAFPGQDAPEFATSRVESARGPGGVQTVIRMQQVGDTKYFDAAGFPRRTIGLD